MSFTHATLWPLALILLLGPTNDSSAELRIGGQVRPRLEFRDPAAGGQDDSFTSMRVRAQLQTTLERDVSVFVQWQDVRLWGEETNTLGDFSADSFDLHQGYVDFGNVGGRSLSIRLGRQEISLGGQRLVGAVGWTQQGRSFDGVRATATPGDNKIDLLAIRLADATAAGIADNAYLAGLQAQLAAARDLQVYLLYNSAGAATDQITLGLRQAGKAGKIAYRAEFAYQTGERGGQDVAAHLIGLRAGTALGKTNLTLWYDRLSGDDDPADGETKVFDTLFATNHKFYGYADYFLNIPVHTAGGGLQDLALKIAHPLRPGLSLNVDLHSFLLTEQGGLDSAHLGEEIDLTLKHKYSKETTCVAGLSYVLADDAFGAIGRLNDDAKFAYAMINVAF
jgi:hypothetical protein